MRPQAYDTGEDLTMAPCHPAASIVILTGAGISRESGLETFRDADGIWSKVRIEDVATPEAFAQDPARVHEFYNWRRANLRRPEIQPNAAHLALARLEREWRGEILLVTQNVDDLHERAGSRQLVHMHGEHFKARCLACAVVIDWQAPLSLAIPCPACGEGGRLRPHVVWFGEIPLEMERIGQALERADLFVAIGTSAQVYPAAAFAAQARAAGAHTVELNLDPSARAADFVEAQYGPASQLVPDFVARLLSESGR
jgi:NAD-dependent deacetylase